MAYPLDSNEVQHTLDYTDTDLVEGMAVYLDDGEAKLALATTQPNFQVLGLVKSVLVESRCVVRRLGEVRLSDWTLVTGTEFLTPATEYYLSETDPGMLTTTAPVTSGSRIMSIGVARNETILVVNVRYYGEVP